MMWAVLLSVCWSWGALVLCLAGMPWGWSFLLGGVYTLLAWVVGYLVGAYFGRR